MAVRDFICPTDDEQIRSGFDCGTDHEQRRRWVIQRRRCVFARSPTHSDRGVGAATSPGTAPGYFCAGYFTRRFGRLPFFH